MKRGEEEHREHGEGKKDSVGVSVLSDEKRFFGYNNEVMKSVEIGTSEAKAQFSELLTQVQRGSQFVITKRGKPVAQLGPVEKARVKRRAGFAKDFFVYVAPDFDAPLAEFAEYR